MNWDKVQKEGRMRRQGTVRALTEDAERRLKALHERKRRKGSRATASQKAGYRVSEPKTLRQVRPCEYCGALIRVTRYRRHVTERHSTT